MSKLTKTQTEVLEYVKNNGSIQYVRNGIIACPSVKGASMRTFNTMFENGLLNVASVVDTGKLNRDCMITVYTYVLANEQNEVAR